VGGELSGGSSSLNFGILLFFEWKYAFFYIFYEYRKILLVYLYCCCFLR
jgi:hypothetical protein